MPFRHKPYVIKITKLLGVVKSSTARFVSPRPVNEMGATSKTRCAKILNRELAEQV